MKILYNHQSFIQKYGGVSRYFVEVANNIALYKNKKVTVKINDVNTKKRQIDLSLIIN